MKIQSDVDVSFLSTPIIAETMREAREILGRRYSAERFRLVKHSKVEFNNGTAWRFTVSRRRERV